MRYATTSATIVSRPVRSATARVWPKARKAGRPSRPEGYACRSSMLCRIRFRASRLAAFTLGGESRSHYSELSSPALALSRRCPGEILAVRGGSYASITARRRGELGRDRDRTRTGARDLSHRPGERSPRPYPHSALGSNVRTTIRLAEAAGAAWLGQAYPSWQDIRLRSGHLRSNRMDREPGSRARRPVRVAQPAPARS